MQETIRAAEWAEQATLPMICADGSVQLRKPRLYQGQDVGGYQLVAPMAVTAGSELWFARSRSGLQYGRYVVKAYCVPCRSEVIEEIRMLQVPEHAAIIDMFEMDGVFFEVSPFYSGGALRGPIPEETLRNQILPALIRGLGALHGAGIVHNDIKPSNLLWNDDGTSVVIADFGSASHFKKTVGYFTPSYTDPYILTNQTEGRCGPWSDWFSVGMTLAELVTGEPMIQETTLDGILHRWNAGIRFEQGSTGLRRLINGLIEADPKRRLGPKAAESWCKGEVFGAETRQRTQKRQTAPAAPMIRFENPPLIAIDQEGLIQGILTHWKDAGFLFEQGKFDRFLVYLDNSWEPVCRELHLLPEPENALFRLSIELLEGDGFLWRGKHYETLAELEETWREGGSSTKDVHDFMQRELAVYYMEKQEKITPKQLAFIKDLCRMSRVHPDEAIRQLFMALRGDDTFRIGNVVFESLADVVDYLYENVIYLDAIVEQLIRDKGFEAWLSFQGMDRALEDIRRKSKA